MATPVGGDSGPDGTAAPQCLADSKGGCDVDARRVRASELMQEAAVGSRGSSGVDARRVRDYELMREAAVLGALRDPRLDKDIVDLAGGGQQNDHELNDHDLAGGGQQFDQHLAVVPVGSGGDWRQASGFAVWRRQIWHLDSLLEVLLGFMLKGGEVTR